MLELTLASVAVFVLAFSVLSVLEQWTQNRVVARVSETFVARQFSEQRVSERDRIFSLFPLEPSPVLFEKLTVAESVLNDPILRLSTKYLGALLAALLFGLLFVTLKEIEPTLMGVDVLTLEMVLFGCLFFGSRYLREPSLDKKKSDGLEPPPAINFPKLQSFFVVFAVILPLFLWALEPTTLLEEISSTANSEDIDEVSLLSNGARLIWSIEFLRILALLVPVFLFLFTLSDARLQIEQKVFEDDDVALGSVTRIKEIATVLMSAVCALAILNVDLSNLSLFSGLAAAGLSVAMRESITNFFSGLQMTWDRSLKIGAVISIPQAESTDTGSTYGIVRDIRSRYTVIEDRNTVRRLVPNYQMVSQTIEHWTHEDESVRLSLRIGIPYMEDPRQVRQAQRIMESVCYDVPRVLTNKPPNALLVKYDDSQLTFSLRFWIEDAQNGIRPVISEVLISLYERLSDAGIRIPFPQQDVRIKELPEGFMAYSAFEDTQDQMRDKGEVDA